MLFIVWHSESTDYVSSYTKSNENHILKLKYREITHNDANKNDFSYHTLQSHHLWEKCVFKYNNGTARLYRKCASNTWGYQDLLRYSILDGKRK